MNQNQKTINDIERYLEFLQEGLAWAAGKSGQYAEFGVLHGHYSAYIVEAAKREGKKAFLVDSFRGMAAPSIMDGEVGAKQYPAGRFDQGGPFEFIDRMWLEGFTEEDYVLTPGWIPDVLHDVEYVIHDQVFAFAYVDLDHYEPTMATLEFLWTRIHLGSIVMVDDFSWERDHLAALACRHFFERHKAEIRVEVFGREAAFRRIALPEVTE